MNTVDSEALCKNQEAYKPTIKDMPKDERPEEKLLTYGVDRLSNAELLALIIRTGTGKKTSVELGEEIITLMGYDGIRGLLRTSVGELTAIKGIGESKAAMIVAAVELGKRISGLNPDEKIKCNRSHVLPELLMDEMSMMMEEHFRIACLNKKKELIKIEEISIGTLDASIAHTRDIFRKAILANCDTIILIHNHPSGDCTPSAEDDRLTARMVKSGEIMGIAVIDHVVIGNKKYYSYMENGKI